MSTSDSDYSIDWLASDEDDYDSPKRLSPQQEEEPLVPPSSSSLRESPPSCFHYGATPRRRRRRSDCCDCNVEGSCGADADSPASPQTPAASPAQGFTSVCSQQTLSVERHSNRKRARSAGVDKLCEKSPADTENELFSQKCVELQCYIQPLSSILRGLRSGRYSERLSSFQESVAMDRIQRIMGVLQNPNMGGRFLSILLKIEEMLQSWFPHVRSNLMQKDDDSPAKKQKQQHHSSASSPPPPYPVPLCSSDVDLAWYSSSTHLKWLHTSPICSLKTPESMFGQRAPAPLSPLPARCSQEVTQDNAVSSSTDLHAAPPLRPSAEPRPRRGPPPFKISSPCLERLLQAKESIIAPRTDGGLS